MRLARSPVRFLFMILLILVIAAGLGLAGCQKAPEPAPAPAPATGEKPAEKPPETPKPEDPRKRTLIIAVPDDIASLDPHMGAANARYNEIRDNVFARLTDYGLTTDDKGRTIGDPFNFREVLATVEISSDETAWIYTIKPGQKTRAGNEITAEMMKWDFERDLGLRGPTSIYRLAGFATVEEPIKGIKVLDTYRLEIRADQYNSVMRPILVMYGTRALDKVEYLKHATADDPWSAEWGKTNIVESGRYMLDKWEPGQQMVFKVNPNWAGEQPYFETVMIRVVPSSSTRATLLANGDVDIALVLSPQEYDQLSSSPGVTVHSYDSGKMTGVLFNVRQPPFDNVHLRRAVSYMVPYDDIIERVYFGRAKRMRSVIPDLVPNYDPSFWEYDLSEAERIAKAKEELQLAGYAGGFTFTLHVNSGAEVHEQIAALVKSELAKAGIEVKIEPLPTGAFNQRKWGQEMTQAFVDELFPWVPDPGYFLDLLYSVSSLGSWWTGYENPVQQELIEQAKYETDETKRQQLYSEAQKLVMAEAPWAFIGAINHNIAMRSDIEGYVYYPDALTRWYELIRR